MGVEIIGMVGAPRIGQTEKGPPMDENNDEQTKILREIWKQMVAMDRNLSGRIDQTNARLDQTNATLNAFMKQTNENFGRVQRNFERLDERFSDDIEARLTRIETHVGLRER